MIVKRKVGVFVRSCVCVRERERERERERQTEGANKKLYGESSLC